MARHRGHAARPGARVPGRHTGWALRLPEYRAVRLDIEADAAHRGQGHGRTLMLLAEARPRRRTRRPRPERLRGQRPGRSALRFLGYETATYPCRKAML